MRVKCLDSYRRSKWRWLKCFPIIPKLRPRLPLTRNKSWYVKLLCVVYLSPSNCVKSVYFFRFKLCQWPHLNHKRHNRRQPNPRQNQSHRHISNCYSNYYRVSNITICWSSVCVLLLRAKDTRKNAQIVTNLQTRCNKSVQKLLTSCLRTACCITT